VAVSKDQQSLTPAAVIVMCSTRDINDATFVGNGGRLSHVVSQQISQQERPYNAAHKKIMLPPNEWHRYCHWGEAIQCTRAVG